MHSLNLGILAHVDAGKTSLTERLLYTGGVIDRLGSVDKGDTQTDSLALERQRGITIKSAVASLPLAHDLTVNLIDTPGHPDFIAEVERVLRVLDGAVLVLSAVEGVQPQTRVLMRALRRLRIPTLLFVNKIDRMGAREGLLLQDISQILGLAIIPMGTTSDLGTKEADFTPWSARDAEPRSFLAETLAENDEQTLISYIDGESRLSPDRLHEQLKAQTLDGLVYPVFFGSARTGAGVDSLISGIAALLLAGDDGDPDAPASGTVFKIERGASREKIAYVRLFSGTVRIRDRLIYGQDHEDKVTAITTFDRQPDHPAIEVSVGNIAKLWGLRKVQIGDRIGAVGTDDSDQQFDPPTMESVVEARDPADRARLRIALGELAEQDPFIKVRHHADLNETTLSLYGEVQKEVVQSTLADDYGIDAEFSETTTIYVERPVRRAEAIELLTSDANPYMATVALRIEPGTPASGVQFRLDVDPRTVPLYIYKTQSLFVDHMTGYIRRALDRGLHGWEVTDCVVTLTGCGYFVADGPRKPTVPMARTTSADFRKLTPTVLGRALERSGTRVCEPVLRLSIESPASGIRGLLSAIAQLGGLVEQTSVRDGFSTVEATMSADRARDLQRQVPGLTGGEGNLESVFDGYQPVPGKPPRRTSTRPSHHRSLS
jgi:ribosomal protection tetracycline resistance protein